MDILTPVEGVINPGELIDIYFAPTIAERIVGFCRNTGTVACFLYLDGNQTTLFPGRTTHFVAARVQVEITAAAPAGSSFYAVLGSPPAPPTGV